MGDVKHQIVIKPRNNQNMPKVLQTLMQKQIEASEDSQDSEVAAVTAKDSGVPNKTKSATLDKGIVLSETTDQSVVGSERSVATLPSHYRSGQAQVTPASTFTTNSTKQQDSPVKTKQQDSPVKTKQQDSPVKTPAVAWSSPSTKTYIKPTNQSVGQRQFTKQSSTSNVADKVIHNSAQTGETKTETLNQLSRSNASTTALSRTTSSSLSSSSPPSSTQQTPSPSSNDDGVVIDFRSALRPTRNSVLSEIFEKSTTNSTPAPTKVASGYSQNVEAKTSPSVSPAAAESQVTHNPWKKPAPALSAQTTTARAQSSNNQPQGHNNQPQGHNNQPQGHNNQPQGHNNKSVMNSDKQERSDIVCRNSDRKQFKRVSVDILSKNLPAPRTSKLPNNIDLAEITLKYLAVIGNIHKSPKTSASDEREEPVKARPRLRVSLIDEISAEDEGASVYDDGYSLSPVKSSENEELYMDGESEKQADGETFDDVYEEAVMMTDSQEVKARKQLQKMKTEAKKKEEKERKEKEKEEKKRLKDEKMKIKKEKELIQQQKHFNLTGHEVIVGQGVMKQDVKDMSLKQGQTVTIVRLDKNPINMWLVSTDAGLGYVNSGLIEVDTAVIREAMNIVKKSSDGEA